MTAPPIRFPRQDHPDDHPLMTVHQVARSFGCSDMTIRRRIEARQIPAVRIGRKSMVPRSFVERLLAEAEAGETVVLDDFARDLPARAQREGVAASNDEREAVAEGRSR